MDMDILDDNLIKQTYKRAFINRPLIIWFSLLGLGLLFKLLGWPLSGFLILIPSAAISAYSINGFFRHKERNITNSAFSLLALLWVIVIISGILFNNGYPYNLKGLTLYLSIFVILSALYYVYLEFLIRKANK